MVNLLIQLSDCPIDLFCDWQGDGLFWPVTYNRNKRRYAAPLNGELKPDTPPIRKMLEEAGIL